MRTAEQERLYSAAYRAEKRAARDKHIDRWLAAGMSADEIKFACGYSMGTIKARVLATSEFVAR